MPNKKAAIKDLRQSQKKAVKNALVKRNIKELIKKGHKAIAAGADVSKLNHDLQKFVDKAVKSGVLKPNTGNRRKSRFATKIKVKPVAKAEVK